MLFLLASLALYVAQRSAVGVMSGLIVVARQTSGQVVIDTYENRGWFWAPPRRLPIASLRVSDWLDGTAVWEIQAVGPRHVVVRYGEVPDGFLQTIPATGRPPALHPGGWYGVIASGHGRTAVTTFSARNGAPAASSSPP
jgi:hypothetical protein